MEQINVGMSLVNQAVDEDDELTGVVGAALLYSASHLPPNPSTAAKGKHDRSELVKKFDRRTLKAPRKLPKGAASSNA